MQSVIERLNDWIREFPDEWTQASEAELSQKPLPHKWSKKEILGHLCDSAVNNHQRFVRIPAEPGPFVVTKYDQNHWVRMNGYQHISKDEILTLWIGLNKQIVRVISNIPGEKQHALCDIGEEKPVPLLWLVRDYLGHMEHHLKQILER